MKRKLLAVLPLAAMLAVTSCNEGANAPTPPANEPPKVTTPGDGYGVLGVVRVNGVYSTPSYPGVPSYDVEYTIGTAIAGFWATAGGTTYVPAGNVTVNDSALAQSNNAYAFQPKGVAAGDDIGLNTYAGQFYWNVTGSSDVEAFTYSGPCCLPNVGKITSDKDITTSAAYTVTLDSYISGGDSVIWILAGPDATITHTTGVGVNSHTFTAEEVGSVGKGDGAGLIQVAPYKITDFTANSKKYYYVRESVTYAFVNLK